MKITFHGAAGTVTGSQHLVYVNGMRILLDCGLFQGRRSDAVEKNRNLPFDAASIDLLILSHAHIDHSGNIPNLVKNGFRGDVICTPATRDLCSIMLLDSGYIQERDAEFVNKWRRRRNEEPIIPIYTRQDALDSIQYFISQGYHRRRKIGPGIWLTFHDAGHMLGSAIVQLEIEDHETSRLTHLVFTGDLGRENIPIIRDPEMLQRADVLIMESTYGDRLHEPYPDAEKQLKRIVTETYMRGGMVIMPAFAVGRTQQIVFTLHKLSQQGAIPQFPVYVDSPLAVNATSVFRLHPECYDSEVRSFMFEPGHNDPFGFDNLTYVQTVEESKTLNYRRLPGVIISASGMAEFGRILHHLKNHIDDPRTTILITGWQAPHTLGRRLAEKAETVRIFGEEHRRRARVETLYGFSGHADKQGLMNFVGAMRERPRRVFLVHGEPESANRLKTALEDKFDLTVTVPVMGQVFKGI